VSDFSDLIHIGHDLFLEHLHSRDEVLQDAEAEDGVRPLPWHDGIQLSVLFHILTNDVGARLSEAQSQQMANFDNSTLKHSRLILLFLSTCRCLALVLVDERHRSSLIDIFRSCNQWILRNESHLLDHPLQWVEDEPLCVLGEQDRAEGENDDDEQRSCNVDDRLRHKGGPGAVRCNEFEAILSSEGR